MTLLEVMIALLILSVVIGPLLGMMVTTVRGNYAAQEKTVATYTAMLRMEELVGLSRTEILNAVTPADAPIVEPDINMTTSIEATPSKSDLLTVKITVRRAAADNNGAVLYELENELYVGPVSPPSGS